MREMPRHQKARLSVVGRAVPYNPELEALGERYGVARIADESATAYCRRVIAAIVTAHERNATLIALLERHLNFAIQILAEIPEVEQP